MTSVSILGTYKALVHRSKGRYKSISKVVPGLEVEWVASSQKYAWPGFFSFKWEKSNTRLLRARTGKRV
ncbi:unnamed protein product [Alternaria burnsii]|nr:unnamed protein product [Alternaria burnsii]